MDRQTLVTCGTVAATGIASYYIWRSYSRKKRVKSLHITYKKMELPGAMKFMTSLPPPLRRYLAARNAAPKPPCDGCDVLGLGGGHDPYGIGSGGAVELSEGKIWRVRYHSLPDPKLADMMKMFGVDMTDREALLASAPEHMRPVLEADLRRTAALDAIRDDDEARLAAGCTNWQDMLIARVGDGDDGGLLLYNPCRMHPPIVEWLKKLGTVRYVVSGSSSHTNQIPQAALAFPAARVVCATSAEIKCRAAGMTHDDVVLYDDPASLKNLNDELRKLSGGKVRLYHVAGDCATQALCVLAHGHLFEVDLLYGHADGDRMSTVSKAGWESPDVPFQLSWVRLFYYAAIYKGKSPTGCVPDYRHVFMDPTAEFPKLMLEQAEPDGSSCARMAESLRGLLRLQFEEGADSAHSSLSGSMPAAEFRRCIDKCWNWLDHGRSLLPSEGSS